MTNSNVEKRIKKKVYKVYKEFKVYKEKTFKVYM